jgi:choline dehydrogenase-like flavoprotein
MPVSFSQTADQYDVVVIGSGLGGLTSANRLAYCGYKVLLLEYHSQLGGLPPGLNAKATSSMFPCTASPTGW